MKEVKDKTRNSEGYISMLETEISYWKKEISDYKRKYESQNEHSRMLSNTISSLMNIVKDMMEESYINQGPHSALLKTLIENEYNGLYTGKFKVPDIK